MKSTKKWLIVIVALTMALSSLFVLAGCEQGIPDTSVILGSSTQLSGDFVWTGLGKSSANASDQDVSGLVNGYATMELNQKGDYVWNKTVVKSHTEEEVDNGEDAPTYKITIELNSGLELSGGTEVTAANYLAYILAMSTPVSTEAFGYNRVGYSLVGWDTFSKYDGTNAAEGVTKEFSGLRLLDEYKFSIEVNSNNYPYYYANTYGAVACHDVNRVLGEGVEVLDDGNGAYLSAAWYTKADDSYTKAAHLKAARDDFSEKYEFSGPYTIEKWDSTNSEVTLALNTKFEGNFEGQKASIGRIVYRLVVSETQFAQLEKGEIDVISGLTGGTDVGQGLAAVATGNFKECHYDRAGYGKLQFDCDFGPTMFQEVRQAVGYILDTTDFANTFCGGYGTVTYGPYSPVFAAYQANELKLEQNLQKYDLNVNKAKEILQNAGWVYDANGNTYSGTGIRYKKLAATEYGVDDVNKTYASAGSGTKYQTVQIGNDYYMPLVINWFTSEDNSVSDLLTTKLTEGTNKDAIGMEITKSEGDFNKLLGEIYRETSLGYGGTPTFNMFNLATGWNTSNYDYSYNWISKEGTELADGMYEDWLGNSSNKLSDPYDATYSWWNEANQGKTYDQAKAAAPGGHLGMNYISMAMMYSVDVGDTEEFNKWFYEYLIRWNELLPDIPLYSNVYYDVYNAKLKDFKTGPFWGIADAIVYSTID